jgi:hypothetical protein
MTATTTQTNPSWLQRLQRRYSDAPKIVKVGFPEGTEAVTVSYPNGTRVVDVAVGNEYGTDNVPARPFMGLSSADITNQCVPILEQSAAALNNNNTQQYDQLLDAAGNLAAGIVKQQITDLRSPPNAQSTIERKGSSNPLIDTGLMRQTVTYKVVDK